MKRQRDPVFRALALSVALVGVGFAASAGSCIISGSTERTAAGVAEKSLTGAFDSFWRDIGFGTFTNWFRIRVSGIALIFK